MAEDEKQDIEEKKILHEEVKIKIDKINYSRQTERPRGTVCFDNIRKDLIKRERIAQSTWHQRFGHLSGENFKKVLSNECKNLGIPIDTFERKLNKQNDTDNKSIIMIKSSPIIPKTSSAFIGWRSSLPKYNLEYFGKLYVSPVQTIEPPIKPNEFRIDKQTFIYLG
ncbi:hypothetical protein HCN44_005754 [Aphidius gifuensis]|uniref:GAG-pre-integrase domain-containing protein n=1 Tax=Aphidius gifuensis TaxID=684658 RepID=A0A835CT69_APHGI|nr:uncharacterized protein LOC122852828 [Aphidius gifuensis]KAF7992973.1 hypothetical protein HCN44_005754 [Aphidius gifuensis]